MISLIVFNLNQRFIQKMIFIKSFLFNILTLSLNYTGAKKVYFLRNIRMF
jgi:small basic protein